MSRLLKVPHWARPLFAWAENVGLKAEHFSPLTRQSRVPTAAPSMHSPQTLVHFIGAPGGGGAEAMLRNLVSAMDATRWRTVVIVMDGRAWPEDMKKLRSAGAEVHDLQATALLRKDTLTRLIRLLRQIRPDVVQTWMHHSDFVAGWCARLAGVKHIVWGIHCREIHRSPGDSDLKMAVFRKLIGLSSQVIPQRIISCSAAALEAHLPLGYPRQAMTWVPNGIDTARFVLDAQARATLRQEWKVPAQAPLIGYIGRFHEMKNLATWLQAAAFLQARRPETHFLLCGGEEWELEECARAALSIMPIRSQVHFIPFRPDPQRVYPALDIFSLSSRTEACPMTIMEALSCGVACVTTDVGDCALLLEGVGRVVPVKDAESLAKAWEDTLAQPPSPETLRHHAVTRFDITVAAQGYAQVYQEVLAP